VFISLQSKNTCSLVHLQKGISFILEMVVTDGMVSFKLISGPILYLNKEFSKDKKAK
jgi:hypothetical protein